MALAKRALKGLGKVGKALTQENNIADGGGLSSLLIPRQVNGAGAAVIVGGGMALSMGNEGFKSRNKASLGRVSYGGGPARMTSSFTSGGVEAMHRVAGGNSAVFADLAEESLNNGSLGGAIENYGATPELISALYNMGGR
jgi:hypothetical protein